MNDFSCWSFVEFYLMESASYEMSTLPLEKQFLRSYQYLSEKIAEYQRPFTIAFAETLRDYLWFAAIGEARHSGRETNQYIEEMEHYLSDNRSSAYSGIARHYPPTEDNLSIVHELFDDYSWGGSYGGGSWATIVRSVRLYDTLTPSAFIDHCADLQHNGGVAFDKGSVPFWSSDGYSMLMNFLSFKFNTPHLIFDIYDWERGSKMSEYISSPTIYIMNKLHSLCRVHRSRMVGQGRVQYNLEYESPYRSDGSFGYIVEGGGGRYCYDCGDSYHEDDMYYDHDMGEYYCEYCVTSCANCYDTVFGSADYYDAGGDAICYSCYTDDYTECHHCDELYLNMDIKELDGYDYCDDCYDDVIYECEECCEDFIEDDMVYEDGCYYCEDCYEEVKCEVCDEIESGNLTVIDLDEYPNQRWLTPNCKIQMCTTCIKKHLDAGVDMWYSTIGIVMSVDIEEVLRYPYKGLLDVHLEREVVHEEFSDNIQGGTYYG